MDCDGTFDTDAHSYTLRLQWNATVCNEDFTITLSHEHEQLRNTLVPALNRVSQEIMFIKNIIIILHHYLMQGDKQSYNLIYRNLNELKNGVYDFQVNIIMMIILYSNTRHSTLCQYR